MAVVTQRLYDIYKVEETVFDPTFPTGITPNDDGLNDNYVILDIGPLIAPGEKVRHVIGFPTRFLE